ncbi:hypothetical protein ACIA47_32450 [Micromonospora sp. NPDC051227]|uniref:hypothetical protein n=1 Tax=Micromonospora sp. NPDC051227 TaxID=3364285 RepID=UPI0037BD9A07
MSKADELRAKAARVAARTAPTKLPAQSAVTPSAPAETYIPTVAAPLAKPVRSTVDLAPDQHRRLQAWINDAAVTLGRARLSKQEVMTALVRRLLADDQLAAAIQQDLRNATQ